MAAFLSSPLSRSFPTALHTSFTSKPPDTRPSSRLTAKRRRPILACLHSAHEEEGPAVAPNVSFEDLVSDEEYVVVDGKDVAMLVKELQASGLDDFSSHDDEDSLSEDFLTLAEKRSDERSERSSGSGKGLDVVHEGASSSDTQTEAEESEEANAGMQYFQEENLQFMPSWAAEAFKSGDHTELQAGANRLHPSLPSQRLHDIVARKEAVGIEGLEDAQVGADGIVDCTVEDVADDYGVPVEFVIDAMLHFGVPLPVEEGLSVRNSMTTEEIKTLLKLITSFDAKDLAERYSDRTISELAEVYDIDVKRILDLCEQEGLHVCRGEQTRLSTVREDRVLDILLKEGALGQPYPSLLDGLV